jgi:hypothetical protein
MDSEFDAKLTIGPRLYRLILVERQNQDLDGRGKARQMQFVTCLGPTHRRAFGIRAGGIYLRARSEVTL